jgi:hypothetical protein
MNIRRGSLILVATLSPREINTNLAGLS